MGAIAQTLTGSQSQISLLWEFLRHELAPYKGRVALVARMVLASTLVMIVGMTFEIPNAAFAALFALLISRESLQATAGSARALVGAAALAGAYVVVGAMLVLGNPMLRFLWVGATLFIVFYA
jgi:multidrug resistance protein MdtO